MGPRGLLASHRTCISESGSHTYLLDIDHDDDDDSTSRPRIIWSDETVLCTQEDSRHPPTAAMGSIPEWKGLVAKHREQQYESIPADWRLSPDALDKLSGKGTASEGKLIQLQAARNSGLLSEKELDITEQYTAGQLLEKMASRELTSREVTVAFAKRAALAQQLTSCLTAIFFTEAIAQAEEADAHLAQTGQTRGPLHGLPVSLKDSFVVKGHYATAGYLEYLKRPLIEKESSMVKFLRDTGAILYCKTNVPQTMMTADSDNNVFGRTLNPHNTKFTAGGSTGGEGALLAFRGSPLGIGTDIAGSIRIPSLCCGIYGFKPTSRRVPEDGDVHCPFPRNILPGVEPSTGPMGHSLADLELLMHTLGECRPWTYDAAALDLDWRPPTSLRGRRDGGKLRIGIVPEDDEYRLHPPVRRALDEAAAKLAAAGHDVVRLPADAARSVGLGARLAFASFGLGQGGPPDVAAMEAEFGEPIVPSLAAGVHPFTHHPPPLDPASPVAQQVADWHRARGAYNDAWRRAWVDHDLDVLLGPGAQHTAVPYDLYGVPAYTCAWNTTNYPACLIPFGVASKELDPTPMKGHAAFDPDYNPETFDGLPCSVQVATPTYRDEECLFAAKIIDQVLNGNRGA